MSQRSDEAARRARRRTEPVDPSAERSPEWLLLVVSLPTASATARMRIWRSLKACGAVALRDGVYLLPLSEQADTVMGQLARECTGQGGCAWLMLVRSRDAQEQAVFVGLFDRGPDYAEMRARWRQEAKDLGSMGAPELNRLLKRLQREYDALRAIDFFPGQASADAEAAWIEVAKRFKAALSPDEPQDAGGRIPQLDPQDYQGRVWATRHHLWVDRVACAWLIRRFIDRSARFCWLERAADCPRDVLGFDFDGATFTHVGNRVSFETLMASFGLDGDPALARIAAIVHYMDVGGDVCPEASGFEAMLAGARERLPDDDALLEEVGGVLDSMYVYFGRESAKPAT